MLQDLTLAEHFSDLRCASRWGDIQTRRPLVSSSAQRCSLWCSALQTRLLWEDPLKHGGIVHRLCNISLLVLSFLKVLMCLKKRQNYVYNFLHCWCRLTCACSDQHWASLPFANHGRNLDLVSWALSQIVNSEAVCSSRQYIGLLLTFWSRKINQVFQECMEIAAQCSWIIMICMPPHPGRGSRRLCTQMLRVCASRISWLSWFPHPQPSPLSPLGLVLSLRQQLKNNTGRNNLTTKWELFLS